MKTKYQPLVFSRAFLEFMGELDKQEEVRKQMEKKTKKTKKKKEYKCHKCKYKTRISSNFKRHLKRRDHHNF